MSCTHPHSLRASFAKWMGILDFSSAEKITMFLATVFSLLNFFCPLKDRAFFVPSSLSCQWICTLLRLRLYPSSLLLSSKKSSKTALLHISLPRSILASVSVSSSATNAKVDQTSSAPFCNPITESRMRSYKKKYRKLLKRQLFPPLSFLFWQSSNLILVHICHGVFCKNRFFNRRKRRSNSLLNGIWKDLV